MAESGSNWSDRPFDYKPHAYDPALNPELFEGVLPRRVVAFLIDLVILAIPIVLASSSRRSSISSRVAAVTCGWKRSEPGTW